MAPETRRFNLGDLIILVAATAAATYAIQGLWDDFDASEWVSSWAAYRVRLGVVATLAACATPMTLACLAFRLRRPRPPWPDAALQPGTAAMLACLVVFGIRLFELAVALVLSVGSSLGAFELARFSTIRFSDSEHLVLVRELDRDGVIASVEPIGCTSVAVTSFAYPAGTAVAAVWLVLALSGRWRPEPSWIDRLGRGLGATWIFLTILAALHPGHK